MSGFGSLGGLVHGAMPDLTTNGQSLHQLLQARVEQMHQIGRLLWHFRMDFPKLRTVSCCANCIAHIVRTKEATLVRSRCCPRPLGVSVQGHNALMFEATRWHPVQKEVKPNYAQSAKDSKVSLPRICSLASCQSSIQADHLQ